LFYQELRKRDVTLVDKSLAEINVTMWGTTAENFDPSGNPVVAIKGCKVSDFNGVSLSTLGSSVVQVPVELSKRSFLRRHDKA
jgi:replication factor A1